MQTLSDMPLRALRRVAPAPAAGGLSRMRHSLSLAEHWHAPRTPLAGGARLKAALS